MGHLTDDMSRLCNEITKGHEERTAFCADLKNQATDMQTLFRAELAEMAETMGTERKSFISHLRRNVAEMKAAFADDLQGAHSAWSSLNTSHRPRKHSIPKK